MRLFGHILRQEDSTPGRQAMTFYFSQSKTCKVGQVNTLVHALQKDLRAEFPQGVSLSLIKDYLAWKICSRAHDGWRRYVVGSAESSYRRYLCERKQRSHVERLKSLQRVQSIPENDMLEGRDSWVRVIEPDRRARRTNKDRHNPIIINLANREKLASGHKSRRMDTAEVLAYVFTGSVVDVHDEKKWDSSASVQVKTRVTQETDKYAGIKRLLERMQGPGGEGIQRRRLESIDSQPTFATPYAVQNTQYNERRLSSKRNRDPESQVDNSTEKRITMVRYPHDKSHN